MWFKNTEMDEDCLTLNVWKPTVAKNLSVMVWIHGGGVNSGSANFDEYDGRFLAGREQVVVVSMQYRVGPLGFLCLKKAMRNKTHMGNNIPLAACKTGLEDQRMALEWVRDHISAFGGDPNKATLFGESAGNASVSLHYLSNGSRPLFPQMIMQSASAFNRWALITPAEAHERSEVFSKSLGCFNMSQAEQVKCLQMVTPEALIKNVTAVYTARAKRRAARLGKLFGGCNMSDYETSAIYASFEFAPTLSNSRYEIFRLFTGKFTSEQNLKHPFTTVMATAYGLSSQGLRQLTNSSTGLEIGDFKTHDPEKFMRQLDAIAGDIGFTCGTQKFAQYISYSDVFSYVFTHKTKNNGFPQWTGTLHGYEIDYVFGMPFSGLFQNNFYRYTYEEEQLSKIVMIYWANFAKHV
ncbi:unnamed protein product [Dibothriocephalus latus]|uniref:Carboxylesterase type B domain-containing protein n=1 Tax=Dibothriocephalus latus TaxID=60516 RepID=A0A3P7QS62_DIBLA|nr:unnamed protein product [Dibothriocephalus latus]